MANPRERYSNVYSPEVDPADIIIEGGVAHRYPPDLVASEHVDWRDVNWLGEQMRFVLPSGLGDVGDELTPIAGEDKARWVKGGYLNVLAFGAVGDGVTDDTAAIQAAVDAAVTVGGGEVVFPPGTYKVATAIQLKPGVFLRGAGSSPSAGTITTILGTAGQNVIELPAAGGNVGFGIERLTINGGLNGIYVPVNTSGYNTYLRMRDVHISGPSQSGMEVLSRIEEWDLLKVTLYGGQYGFRYNGARMDKCLFNAVETRSQTKNGWNITTSEYAGANTWVNPIIHFPAEHGFVAKPSAGSASQWVFINPYTEGVGQSGKSAKTTGTITAGTNSLVVASASGFAVNDPIVIRGAGGSGFDHVTTISAIAGTTFTLAANASTSVSGLWVTNGSFDEFFFDAPNALSDVLFLGGLLNGSSGNGHVRYGINAAGAGFHWTLVNVHTEAGSPVYDPWTRLLGMGLSDIRQPNNFTTHHMQTSTFAGANTSAETVRTLVASPAGRDLVLALRDANDNMSGTFGNFDVRRNDGNKYNLLHVNGAASDVRTRHRFVEQGLAGGWAGIPAGATTVDVSLYSRHKTANTAPTTITNFTGGIVPMTIKILCLDTNTTIANNATIKTNTGANKLLVANRVYTFSLDGTVWYEDGQALPTTFNVRDYGAKGDDTTDDRAAIQAAIDACGAAGGGTVLVPPGTYRLNSQTITGVGGAPANLCISYDNVEIVGSGPSSVLKATLANTSMFLISGAAKGARIATGSPQNWYQYGWHESGGTGAPQATVYTLSGSYAKGAVSVTLATPAQASNFAVGDYICLRTGQTLTTPALGQPDAEINRIDSVNAGTGVLGLRWPTAKPYAQEYYVAGTGGVTSTSVTANLAPYGVQNVQSRLLLRPRLADLSLQHTAGGGAAIIGGQALEPTWERIVWQGANSFESFGGHRGHTVRDCHLYFADIPGSAYCFSADQSTSDAQFVGNQVYADAGSQVPIIHIHEGAARVLIAENQCICPIIAVDTNWLSVRARAYDISIVNNQFEGGGNVAAGIYVDPTCTGGGLIAGNTIDTLQPTAAAIAVATGATGWQVAASNRAVQGYITVGETAQAEEFFVQSLAIGTGGATAGNYGPGPWPGVQLPNGTTSTVLFTCNLPPTWRAADVYMEWVNLDASTAQVDFGLQGWSLADGEVAAGHDFNTGAPSVPVTPAFNGVRMTKMNAIPIVPTNPTDRLHLLIYRLGGTDAHPGNVAVLGFRLRRAR